MVTKTRGRRPARRWSAGLMVVAVVAMATACLSDLNQTHGDDAYILQINDAGVLAGWGTGGGMALFEPAGGRVVLPDPHNWRPVTSSCAGLVLSQRRRRWS